MATGGPQPQDLDQLRITFLTRYQENFERVINVASTNPLKDYSVEINLTLLKRHHPNLWLYLRVNVLEECEKWNVAAQTVQQRIIESREMFLEEGFCAKQRLHVRFLDTPVSYEEITNFPDWRSAWQLIESEGTVMSVTAEVIKPVKMLVECPKCHATMTIETGYTSNYAFKPPPPCAVCHKSFHNAREQPPEFDIQYQEIVIQEDIEEQNHFPKQLTVMLERDLVNSCQPGDSIRVIGELALVPKGPDTGALILKLFANNVIRKEGRKQNLSEEELFIVRDRWESKRLEVGSLAAMDLMVESFCPEIYGSALVKLALLISIASCAKSKLSRSNAHVLLVGDPGVGKSELMAWAASVAPHSFMVSGKGVSTAGLLAGVKRSEGEAEIEAGALILADGGICCIDEFNRLQDHDKGAVHEPMEQQQFSLTKAGINRRLNARCSIIGATNPKHDKGLYGQTVTPETIGLDASLLDRFDLCFILVDRYEDDEWNLALAEHHWRKNDLTPTWSKEELKQHLLAIRSTVTVVKDNAKLIFKKYYLKCRLLNQSSEVEQMITLRLSNSLLRVSEAYARLMFKTEVSALDAIMVVLLMESTYRYGNLVDTKVNPVYSKAPLAPTPAQVREILTKLELVELIDSTLYELAEAKVGRAANVARKVSSTNILSADFRPGSSSTQMPPPPSQRTPRPSTSDLPSQMPSPIAPSQPSSTWGRVVRDPTTLSLTPAEQSRSPSPPPSFEVKEEPISPEDELELLLRAAGELDDEEEAEAENRSPEETEAALGGEDSLDELESLILADELEEEAEKTRAEAESTRIRTEMEKPESQEEFKPAVLPKAMVGQEVDLEDLDFEQFFE